MGPDRRPGSGPFCGRDARLREIDVHTDHGITEMKTLVAFALAALLLAAPAVARAQQDGADADRLLEEAYRRKAAHDLGGAAQAFSAARAAGADSQHVALELAYLAVSAGDVDEARSRFEEAERGADPELSRRARAELKLLPRHFFADVYADAYGWKRIRGAPQPENLVPTLRLRGFYRPLLTMDLAFYAFAQATRDVASRGRSAAGLPQIYADDHAILGAGVMLRAWGRRLGLFAQAGPAINLLDDGRQRVTPDVRAGVFLGAETTGCAPKTSGGASLLFLPCAEVYAEAVYVSRFDHNIIAFARPRLSLSYLVTGPVAWQVVAEGRLAKDRNDDFYNNFVDGGAGLRFRLLAPFRLDVMLGGHVGTYFGLQNRDPAPRPLDYADVRLQAATYLEL
jgi:hypothetical protein